MVKRDFTSVGFRYRGYHCGFGKELERVVMQTVVEEKATATDLLCFSGLLSDSTPLGWYFDAV